MKNKSKETKLRERLRNHVTSLQLEKRLGKDLSNLSHNGQKSEGYLELLTEFEEQQTYNCRTRLLIESVADLTTRSILIARYVDGLSIVQTGFKVNYCPDHVIRRTTQGIKEILRHLEEREVEL